MASAAIHHCCTFVTTDNHIGEGQYHIHRYSGLVLTVSNNLF